MANIIIQLKNRKLMEQCCQYLGKKEIAHLRLTRLHAISLPRNNVTELFSEINRGDIELITEDSPIQLIARPQVKRKRNRLKMPLVQLPWGIKRIGVYYTSVPRRYARPKVAILDSGVSPHPNLQLSSLRANFSSETSPEDLNGHGTHIAGIIGGFSLSHKKGKHAFRGVYPKLPLISVKAFGQDGQGTLSGILRGIEWCMDHHIRVINMSFGMKKHHPLLHQMIRLAHEEGILMVAASGNEGKPGLSFPARYPEVIAVGAMNRENRVSSFSQFGTNLDVVAPGEEILSTWLKHRFATLSGTSMACAHVTGLLALMLSLAPELSPSKAKEYLLAHTETLPVSYLLQGHGLVSVKKIIACLKK